MSDDDNKDEGVESRRELKTEPIYGQSAGPSPGAQGDGLAESSGERKTMPSSEPRELADQEADRVVKICKSCMVSQQGDGDRCVECGAELVSIRSVRDSCIGEVVGDKYTIVDKIGAGGMGDVYLGLNEPLGQQVAIKFLNEKFTSDEKIVLRFLNEARSYCKVNHPNAVTLLEYGQHSDGSLYLITEYIEGDGLTQVVRREGPLSAETIVSVGVQVCEVLSAAHNQGIIHRDLKPDNLMMISGSRGRYAVKVLDFGIAKIADDDRQGPMTETGSVFGTPEFMSPEQARGESAEPRSDLYALGVILYYMATATLPFGGKNKLAILNKQLNQTPTPPSQVCEKGDVDPELEEIILHCLQKDPANRPASADAVAEALESIDWRDRSRSSAPSKRSTKLVEDGPAAEEHGDIGGLEMSISDDEPNGMLELSFGEEEESEDSREFVFGDESADASELAFGEEIDAMGPTIDRELGDEESTDEPDEFGLRFDTEEPDRSRVFQVARGLERPARVRSAALGLLATLLVVGSVVYWSASHDRSSIPDGSAEMTAVNAVWEGRLVASLMAADALVDAGEIGDADAALAMLDAANLSNGTREQYDEIVARASRVSNTQMQLRSAVNSRACERAGDLLNRLQKESIGAAERNRELVHGCADGDTPPRAEAAPEPTPQPSPPPRQPAAEEPQQPPAPDPPPPQEPREQEPEAESLEPADDGDASPSPADEPAADAQVPAEAAPDRDEESRDSSEVDEDDGSPDPQVDESQQSPDTGDEREESPAEEEDEDDVVLPPREI